MLEPVSGPRADALEKLTDTVLKNFQPRKLVANQDLTQSQTIALAAEREEYRVALHQTKKDLKPEFDQTFKFLDDWINYSLDSTAYEYPDTELETTEQQVLILSLVETIIRFWRTNDTSDPSMLKDFFSDGINRKALIAFAAINGEKSTDQTTGFCSSRRADFALKAENIVEKIEPRDDAVELLDDVLSTLSNDATILDSLEKLTMYIYKRHYDEFEQDGAVIDKKRSSERHKPTPLYILLSLVRIFAPEQEEAITRKLQPDDIEKNEYIKEVQDFSLLVIMKRLIQEFDTPSQEIYDNLLASATRLVDKAQKFSFMNIFTLGDSGSSWEGADYFTYLENYIEGQDPDDGGLDALLGGDSGPDGGSYDLGEAWY